MRALDGALLLLTAVAMAAANLLIKAGLARAGAFSLSRGGLRAAFAQPLLLTGLALVAGSGLLWFYLLSRAPMSTVYPIFIGATYILIALGAVVLFREPMGAVKITGMALILGGILLVARA